MALLWETHKGILDPCRLHLLSRQPQKVGLDEIVFEDDQYRGLHAMIVGGTVR